MNLLVLAEKGLRDASLYIVCNAYDLATVSIFFVRTARKITLKTRYRKTADIISDYLQENKISTLIRVSPDCAHSRSDTTTFPDRTLTRSDTVPIGHKSMWSYNNRPRFALKAQGGVN